MLQLLIEFGSCIEFLPVQANIKDFYSSIDVLVMPSKEETFGMVALEAIMAKKTVFISSNCGISEIINNHEKYFIFENNPYELADRIESLFINPEKLRPAKDNLYKTACSYTWEKTFNDLNYFLNENHS